MSKHSLNILITAGPTREYIDSVRFISNPSTGFMGYQLASVASKRGHKVILISGPTYLSSPKKVNLIKVTTSDQMKIEVDKFFPSSDCLIMSAAVSDFRSKQLKKEKIKKENIKSLKLELEKTEDILYQAGKNKDKKILVGFALEDKDILKRAKKKLKAKNLDLIVANKIGRKKSPFGNTKVEVIMIDKSGQIKEISPSTKYKLANLIIQYIENLTFQNSNNL